MRKKSLFLVSLGAAIALVQLVDEPGACADRGRNPLAGQPAVRHRAEMRRMRFEVSPNLVLSLNQPYLIGVGGGLNAQFHFNDWIGLGASFQYNYNLLAPFASQVRDALPDTYTGDAKLKRQPTKAQFDDHLVGPSMMFSLYGALTPIGGKFALFNSLFARYDFYGIVGFAGVLLNNPVFTGAASLMDKNTATGNDVNLQKGDFTGFRPGGVVGIGTHFFFNDFVGLQVEVRNYFYKSNPLGLDVSTTDRQDAEPRVTDNSQVLTRSDEYIVNNLYLGLGITFLLPPKAQISR